jgi:hypothetical protein
MKKAIFLVLIGISFISFISSGVCAGGSVTEKLTMVTGNKDVSVTKNIVVAANNDQPCYAGGKYVGNCSRTAPYYNVFSGECYSTLQDCKKADGDLSNVQGSGGCVRCGK